MKQMSILVMVCAWLFSACAAVVPIPTLPVSTPTFSGPATHPEESPAPISGGGYPAAVFAAWQALAAQLNIPVEQIQVDAIESTEWPDACLGLAGSDEVCAQVITPGYRILLRVDLAQYEFHTNQDGTSLRQMQDVRPGNPDEEARPALFWENAGCNQLSITLQAAFYGKCGESLTASPAVTPAAVEQVTQWLGSYAPFDANTMAGKVSFHGFGPNVASPAEQRMLAEWAQLTYDIAQSGRTGAAWGLAFSYNRSGGIAGFCDNVAVYLAGYAQVSDCKGINTRITLTATQLEQVYSWFDGYRQIDYSESDPAVADAMTIALFVPGRGSANADKSTIRAISDFATDLLAQASYQQQAVLADLEAAQAVIQNFLTALNDGDYIQAAKLYGGDTSLLAGWSPDITADLPAWLERGCTRNGLTCLSPRSLTYRCPDADGALGFTVEYNNPDGTLFRQESCCLEGSGLESTAFLVRARQEGDLWLVLDLPPYAP
jgi:hypothetical protein